MKNITLKFCFFCLFSCVIPLYGQNADKQIIQLNLEGNIPDDFTVSIRGNTILVNDVNPDSAGIRWNMVRRSAQSNSYTVTESGLPYNGNNSVPATQPEMKAEPWLGVETTMTDKGVTIFYIMRESPLKYSGIKKGDIIKSVDGVEVKDQLELLHFVESKKPGDIVRFMIYRDGEIKSFDVSIGRKNIPGLQMGKRSEGANSPVELGITLSKAQEEEYWKVMNIEENSLAEHAGFMKDDFILEVNHKKLKDPTQISELIRNLSFNNPVIFKVKRNKKIFPIVVQATR
ncbi:MAG: PDZ domain-containing protein [Saprospiraceae bacterium]|nr:PDZ domain-containing protein [Saprospiraceae bacterium]